jgi:hypothetical protein
MATFSNRTDLGRVAIKIDPAKFRKQANECHEQAIEAGNPVDREAWLRLAEDFIKLAGGVEQVRYLQASPALNVASTDALSREGPHLRDPSPVKFVRDKKLRRKEKPYRFPQD